MADDIYVPTFDEMMQPLLEALKHIGRESELKEMRELVASLMQLSPKQLSILHKPDSSDRRTKFEYNLAWTCTYLKNAGYIKNVGRGKWVLSEQGYKTHTLDVQRIKRDVRTYRSGSNGEAVTIPTPQDDSDEDYVETHDEVANTHTEIQWLLLKLGQDLKLDIWIATNDRGKQYNGNVFELQTRVLKKLPPRFDEATQRTIELIDILWLKGQAIVAAFEIENTSSIYSGLLRLSDLTAMQPDIDIPLYIVAPDERQRKVILEINRPTFSKATNLVERCRYISYSRLRDAIQQAAKFISHLSPTFIDEFSEQVDSTYNQR